MADVLAGTVEARFGVRPDGAVTVRAVGVARRSKAGTMGAWPTG